MTYRSTPIVRHNTLHDPQRQLSLDSPAWFAWLEKATRFYYIAQYPAYRLTVRKEKRRQTAYWFAYVKRDGKLHNAYLGKSATLTQQKLEAVAVRLNQEVIQMTEAR